MIAATECANPASTVAFGCCRLRRHANQFFMWEEFLSELKGSGPYVFSTAPIRSFCGNCDNCNFSPLALTYFSERRTKGLLSCVPFSSTSFHRWLPSPPILISVPLSPMRRVELAESFPKLVE